MDQIPEHPPTADCWYLKNGRCYWCCDTCNLDLHRCHFCGDPLRHDNKSPDGKPHPCYTCEEEGCNNPWEHVDANGNQWCDWHIDAMEVRKNEEPR